MAESTRGSRTLLGLIVASWLVIIGAVVSAVWMGVAIWSAAWPVPIGIERWWPQVSSPETDRLTAPETGGFTVGQFVVPGISAEVRIDTILGVALQAALVIAAAVAVLRLSRRLHDGEGLAGTSRDVGLLGVAVLVCGALWQVAFGMAAIVGGQEVFGTGVGLDRVWQWPDAATVLEIDLWPIPVAAALGAASLAFGYAERVEREAEGLV